MLKTTSAERMKKFREKKCLNDPDYKGSESKRITLNRIYQTLRQKKRLLFEVLLIVKVGQFPLHLIKKQCFKVSRDNEIFIRPDIVYTTPGLRDEMTVWGDEGKMKLRKY